MTSAYLLVESANLFSFRAKSRHIQNKIKADFITAQQRHIFIWKIQYFKLYYVMAKLTYLYSKLKPINHKINYVTILTVS